MNPNPWLTDRRWRWRFMVLLIVLGVFGGFMAHGENVLGALAGVVMVFLVAENVIDKIIKDDNVAPPEDKVTPPPTGPLTMLPGGLSSLRPRPGVDSTPSAGDEELGAGDADAGDLDQAA